MAATFKPLRSEYGFESPGFSVSPTGQLTIASGGPLEFSDRVNVNDSLYVSNQIYIDNIPLLDLTTPSINKLSSSITESYLTKLATLQNLEVEGNVSIQDASSNLNLSIVNGTITISSVGLGNIDNIVIGQNQPVNGYFKNVSVGNISNLSELSVTGTMTVSISASIPTITSTTVSSGTGNITTVNSTTGNITTVNSTAINSTEVESDNITINNTPVEAYHATRKDYVDRKISAFAIAFGA